MRAHGRVCLDFSLGPRIVEALLLPSPSHPGFLYFIKGDLLYWSYLGCRHYLGENNKWGNRMNLQRRGVGFVLLLDWFSGPHSMNAISWWVCFLCHLSWVSGLLCTLKSYRSPASTQIVLLYESQSARSPEGIYFLRSLHFPLHILFSFFLSF